MKRITIILSSLLLVLAMVATGQPGDTYYYYKGEKVSLQLNTDYAYIVVAPGVAADAAQLSSLLGASVEITTFDQSNVAQTLQTDVSTTTGASSEYWAEVKLRENLSYTSQMDALRGAASVVLTAPYFQNEMSDKIGLSNYFYVKLARESDLNLLLETAEITRTEVVGQNRFMPLWYTLKCTGNTLYNALEAANYFHETGRFEIAEPSFMFDNLLNYTPNDPLYNTQWGLNNTGQNGGTTGIDINAEDAWDVTTGDPGVIVAVLDHGFEMNHPDLAANNFGTGFNTGTGTSPALVLGSHGTTCAGIIGAVQDNNLGVSGVAPDARLMSISNSLFISPTIQQELADGLNWAWINGADIISNSWAHNSLASGLIDNAITNALANGRGGLGTVVVFSAGNNDGAIIYPANSNPGIITVGAMSPCGERTNPASCDGETWWGSNFGNELDVIAPGVLIPTTDRQGSAGYDIGDYIDDFNGTSAACPFVAGVAALVLSVNPNLTVQEVNDIIEQSGQKVGGYNYQTTAGRPNGTWDDEVGYGLVDAHAAVLLAQDCQDNLTITASVLSGTDQQEANLTITATNIIASAATAIYHAGNAVTMAPGFHAQNGTTFRAYNEGCTGNFTAITRASEATVATARGIEAVESLTEDPTSAGLILYPNPADGTLSVRLGKGDAYSISIYDDKGTRLLTGDLTASEEFVDVSSLPNGSYFIVVTNNETQQTEKGKFMISRR